MDEAYGCVLNSSNVTDCTDWNATSPYSNNDTNITNSNGTMQIIYSYNDIPFPLVFIYIIVGTIGNCLVILAISLDRNLHNQPNYLRLSFAVADLLIGILSLPGRIVLFNFAIPPSLHSLCYVELIVLEYTFFSSMVHVAAISLDRYFAIKSPLNEREHSKKKVAIKIGLVWLISSITTVLHLIPVSLSIMGGRTNDNPPQNCIELYYTMPYFSLVFVAEVLVMFGAVVVIAVTLILVTILLYKLIKKQNKNGDLGLVRTVGGKKKNDSDDKKSPKTLKTEQKALMVVWLLSVTFLICTMPHIYIAMTAAAGYIGESNIVFLLENSLIFANPCINPFIYTIFNKRFRDDYKNLLLFRYKKVMET